jgi:hypothetical protein
MGVLDAYDGLMENFTLKRLTGINGYGDPTTTSTTIRGILFYDWMRTFDASGEKMVQYAFIQTADMVNPGDIVTVGGVDYPVVGVQYVPGWNGVEFRVAALGSNRV